MTKVMINGNCETLKLGKTQEKYDENNFYKRYRKKYICNNQ